MSFIVQNLLEFKFLKKKSKFKLEENAQCGLELFLESKNFDLLMCTCSLLIHLFSFNSLLFTCCTFEKRESDDLFLRNLLLKNFLKKLSDDLN